MVGWVEIEVVVAVVVGVRRIIGRRWEASLIFGLGHVLPHRSCGVLERNPLSAFVRREMADLWRREGGGESEKGETRETRRGTG